MLVLYDYDLSGNCYKVRLLLDILGVPYERRNVDFFPGLKHREAGFLAINPLGQLPVLQDGDLRLTQSQAIMAYVARKFDTGGTWFPLDPPEITGQVMQWLGIAEGLTTTASAARLADGMGFDFDADAARAGAHRLFAVIDEHLWFQEKEGHDWLVAGPAPTIADIACFPYIMLSEEGGIPRETYPAIRRWSDRFKRIPGFTVMPGIFPATLGT